MAFPRLYDVLDLAERATSRSADTFPALVPVGAVTRPSQTMRCIPLGRYSPLGIRPSARRGGYAEPVRMGQWIDSRAAIQSPVGI